MCTLCFSTRINVLPPSQSSPVPAHARYFRSTAVTPGDFVQSSPSPGITVTNGVRPGVRSAHSRLNTPRPSPVGSPMTSFQDGGFTAQQRGAAAAAVKRARIGSAGMEYVSTFPAASAASVYSTAAANRQKWEKINRFPKLLLNVPVSLYRLVQAALARTMNRPVARNVAPTNRNSNVPPPAVQRAVLAAHQQTALGGKQPYGGAIYSKFWAVQSASKLTTTIFND